jgi:CHAT domain-containing protein
VIVGIALLMAVAMLPLSYGHPRKPRDSQSTQPKRHAEELFQSALLLVETKERESAHQLMQEAMRLWMQGHEPEKAARAFLQIGDAYNHAQNYLESLYYYKRLLDLKPLSGSAKAAAYNAIAQVYAELNERDLAKDYFTKAIERAQSIRDVSAEASAWEGLADLHHRGKERRQALSCVARARTLNRLLRDEVAEAALLHITGQINQEEGRSEEARKALAEALTIYRRSGNIAGQVKVLCSMSDLSLAAFERKEALAQAMEAVELAEAQAHRAIADGDKTRARDLRWRAWLRRARAERAAGEIELAAKSYQSALANAEGLWWLVKILSEASAIGFRQETEAIYREYVDLLMEKGDLNEAYRRADDTKARTIRGMTEGRRRKPSPRQDAQAGTRRKLPRPIAGLRTQLFSAIPGVEREKLQKEIREAEYALQEKQVAAEIENSRFRVVWSEPATVAWLRERMSRDKSALVEFLLGETRSFVWLITSEGVSCEILQSRKEIEKAVRPYLEALRTAPNNVHLQAEIANTKEQSTALFSLLIGNLTKQITPGQKLIIVPDGLLHYLPFETLIHDGRYLIQDHEISYNPSASMLSLWPDSSRERDDSKKMELLAFGDPVFESGLNARNAGKPAKTHIGQTMQSVRAAQGFSLARLPRTRDEVQDIASLFPPERRRVYLGAESTEDAVKRESLRDYKRLHFATHSLTDEESPSRSAVVLSLDGDPQEDGFLEASEIAELDMDCDLAVLSACQTGRGQLFSGEGIVGLSRAFLIAGARSVVVSLWNVTEISTGQLMKNFYKQLARGAGNASALRDAKLQMIDSTKEIQHPYYWAPFVMIGRP